MALETLAPFSCKKDMNLEKYFAEFQETFMPADFIWRNGQKEAVEKIIEGYHDPKCKAVILDAPVGSGKSLIAMCSSWILNQEGHKGYVLSSDISLQDQYENDLKNFRIRWGSVKGLDNYECIDNMERTSLGTCKIQGKEARKMPCYSECPYYTARSEASQSSTSMLNYAYWLIMMNEVNPKMDEDKQLFPKRDFAFCDEAHKLLDIIQSTYSPKFSPKHIEKIEKLVEFFEVHKMGGYYEPLDIAKKAFKSMNQEEDPEKLLALISSFALALDRLQNPIEVFRNRVKSDYPKSPPKEWRRSLRIADWVTEFKLRLSEYINIIDETSLKNMVKNPNGDEIVFNCLEESYLMHKYFHVHTGFPIFMSATFSDPSAYLRGIALKGAKYIKLESSFDFDKSPIYFFNSHRMTYSNIEKNLPWLIDKINRLISNHEGESGLIHSASYKLSMDIFNGLTPQNRSRVLIYNGTEEKRNFLDELKKSNDKILLGPSLLEGLDMKDDFARFMIFAKTPYPSLADRFIKTKMNINPEWYAWKSSLNIIQGIGRGVRNQKDYCITYYLDATLGDLISKNRKMFPSDFMKRIKVVQE
jgi:Rad3-related DNA helicase